MKKIGNWYLPDDENKESIKDIVISEKFPCIESLNYAFSLVKKFENAIDVGTWIGDSTVLMSSVFNNIIGFEPAESVYDCCVKNLQDRNIFNCELKKVAVSNLNGVQYLINKGKSFSGWIDTRDASAYKKKNQVNSITLDSLELTNIDFIKIDVDSHEGFLVQGAVNFFRNNSPVVMIESKKRDQLKYQNLDMPDPISLLQNLNYKIIKKLGKADYILSKEKV